MQHVSCVMLCGRVLHIFSLVVHMFKRFGRLHAPGNELWDVFDYLKNYLICAGPAAVGYDLVEYWLGSKSRAI